MAEDRGVSSTQVGAIGENLVATQLILHSKGRLSPFKPIADDMGIDLLVYDKRTGNALPLQIKSRTKTIKRTPKIVHFEVRGATFNANQDAYILALLFELEESNPTVTRAWLIPMKELSGVAMKPAGKLVLRPSLDMLSKDRYSNYRCEGLKKVTRRLVSRFDKT